MLQTTESMLDHPSASSIDLVCVCFSVFLLVYQKKRLETLFPDLIKFLIFFLYGKKSKIKSVIFLSSNNFAHPVRHNPLFHQHFSKHDTLPLSELWVRTIG